MLIAFFKCSFRSKMFLMGHAGKYSEEKAETILEPARERGRQGGCCMPEPSVGPSPKRLCLCARTLQ